MEIVRGEWILGHSAGGSRNNLPKFATNDQYLLSITEPGEKCFEGQSYHPIGTRVSAGSIPIPSTRYSSTFRYRYLINTFSKSSIPRKEGKKGKIQAEKEAFFKGNHSFFDFVFVLEAKSLPFCFCSLKYFRFEVRHAGFIQVWSTNYKT